MGPWGLVLNTPVQLNKIPSSSPECLFTPLITGSMHLCILKPHSNSNLSPKCKTHSWRLSCPEPVWITANCPPILISDSLEVYPASECFSSELAVLAEEHAKASPERRANEAGAVDINKRNYIRNCNGVRFWKSPERAQMLQLSPDLKLSLELIQIYWA